jgi:hypothetical protein
VAGKQDPKANTSSPKRNYRQRKLFRGSRVLSLGFGWRRGKVQLLGRWLVREQASLALVAALIGELPRPLACALAVFVPREAVLDPSLALGSTHARQR